MKIDHAGSIEITIARSKIDIENSFGLVYKSYLEAGLIAPNDLSLKISPYHLLPTTEIIVAKKDGRIIATATLIIDSKLGIPADNFCREEMDELRSKDISLAEIVSLASDKSSPHFIGTLKEMTKLMAQVAKSRKCNGIIAITNHNHANLFVKRFGFKKINEPKLCPFSNRGQCTVLLLDLNHLKDSITHKYLFGKPFSQKELEMFLWPKDLISHFIGFLEILFKCD